MPNKKFTSYLMRGLELEMSIEASREKKAAHRKPFAIIPESTPTDDRLLKIEERLIDIEDRQKAILDRLDQIFGSHIFYNEKIIDPLKRPFGK